MNITHVSKSLPFNDCTGHPPAIAMFAAFARYERLFSFIIVLPNEIGTDTRERHTDIQSSLPGCSLTMILTL